MMKRSHIDRIIDQALSLCSAHGFHLPPWAHWTCDDWKQIGAEADEIRHHGLGWNATDFGGGDFEAQGLLLCVIRNGWLKDGKPATTKTYAEKAFIVGPGQVTPWHFHWMKTEDLLNRGGGRLEVEVAWADNDNEKSLSDKPVEVKVDSIARTVKPGESLILEPGQSIEFPPRMWHKFYGKSGDQKVIAGEVSSLNDDATDNCFLTPFATGKIEEDSPAKYPLLSEYFTLAKSSCC